MPKLHQIIRQVAKAAVCPYLPALTLVSILSLASCNSDDVMKCHIIGCDSGIELTVCGDSVQETIGGRVREVISPGVFGETKDSIHSTIVGDSCRSILIYDFVFEDVELTLYWQNDSVVLNIQGLQFETIQPNGPDCEPTCEVAGAMVSY